MVDKLAARLILFAGSPCAAAVECGDSRASKDANLVCVHQLHAKHAQAILSLRGQLMLFAIVQYGFSVGNLQVENDFSLQR